MNEPSVGGVHGERAGDDNFAREIARLLKNVINAGPVNGQEQSVGIAGGFRRRPGTSVRSGVASEAFEFCFAACVAKRHVVAGAGEDCTEFGSIKPEPSIPMRISFLS